MHFCPVLRESQPVVTRSESTGTPEVHWLAWQLGRLPEKLPEASHTKNGTAPTMVHPLAHVMGQLSLVTFPAHAAVLYSSPTAGTSHGKAWQVGSAPLNSPVLPHVKISLVPPAARV